PGIDPSLLSVIVPARDEEARLPALLASLQSQGARPLEIIVVDDHSRDHTAELAAGLGARVIPAPPLPVGWTGKTWACWNGALGAQGEHLLFLDADVALEPGGMERILRLPLAEPGVHSICPWHRVVRPHEGLSAFFNLVMVAGMNAFTALGPRTRGQGLFGQSLLVRKEDYRAAGGHEAVKGHILENLFLARRFVEKGIVTYVRVGRGTLSMRMFPEGPAALIRGWTKAFASGSRATPLAVLAPIAAWLSGAATLPCLAPFIPVMGYGVAAATFYLAYAAQIGWQLRRVGSYSPLVALLYPVPLFFYFAVFFRSAMKARSGQATDWRGRDVLDRH
ncbi:MAG: glycosyltransferase, partial [Planctomycetes bacterium]|nr:glycosyltransferase [Planctomycetota bacterium]